MNAASAKTAKPASHARSRAVILDQRRCGGWFVFSDVFKLVTLPSDKRFFGGGCESRLTGVWVARPVKRLSQSGPRASFGHLIGITSFPLGLVLVSRTGPNSFAAMRKPEVIRLVPNDSRLLHVEQRGRHPSPRRKRLAVRARSLMGGGNVQACSNS